MQGIEPHPYEDLASFINRARPAAAPRIEGAPLLDPRLGWTWCVDGWTVEVELTAGIIEEINWGAPDGHGCLGYTLSNDGRTAMIDDDAGDSIELDHWPAAT